MLGALVLSFRQLDDPAIRRLLVRCLLLALATFAVLIGGVAGLLGSLDLTGMPWLDTLLAIGGSAAALVIAWLLFPLAIAIALAWFADDVAAAVERRHYPDLPPPAGMGLGESVWSAARFAAVAVALNLLVLPLYLLPGPNLLIYLALNGYLLGREYFEQVAGRRLRARTVSALRRRASRRLWLAGMVIAAILTVPLLNLIAPVIAIAFMVHLFEALRRSERMTVAEASGSPRREAVAARPAGDRSV